ncbi:prepilin-type N-terminal cleavage/methylation domain-containing protein [Marinilactibacillus piezotolerans]|uniref:prepilin-type N-terminal cleavage/methylation domain-containing protein n=1 Tax=Marinilactibacillus piezotolerans TaxID=258723 RepID=UPI0009B043F4|nr:prepilin-type N-terminal cleavage/methylation domain-containing protein [Marinilactibacillus piezotolerans]
MRNQIKKMMKKENGFTLVELLAVLAILAIIVAIAVPAIGNIMDTAKKSAESSEEQLVIDAARLYDVEKDIPEGGVLISDLIKDGYLEGLSDDSKIKKDQKVEVLKDATTGEINYDIK